MTEKKPSESHSRRKFLAGIAAGTGGLALGVPRASANDWNCSSDCNGRTVKSGTHNLSVDSNYDVDSRSLVQWYSSAYSRDKWVHDFVVCGIAACEGHGGIIEFGQLHGQRYEVRGPDGDVLAYTNNNYHGTHPKRGHTGAVEDWVQPVMETAIGSVSVGAAWLFLVNNQFRDKLAPQEGFDPDVPDGFGFTDVYGSGEMEAIHFHRVRYETEMYEPTVNIRSDFSDYSGSNGYTIWKNLEFTINPANGQPLSVGLEDGSVITGQESHPSQMSQQKREVLGVKNVSDEERTIMHKGEELEVEYVAEQPPVRDVTANNFTTKEKTK